MSAAAKVSRRRLTTNREAEQLLCPLLSTVEKNGRITRVNCMHEACALWSSALPSGSDRSGNGLGRCELPAWHAQSMRRLTA